MKVRSLCYTPSTYTGLDVNYILEKIRKRKKILPYF